MKEGREGKVRSRTNPDKSIANSDQHRMQPYCAPPRTTTHHHDGANTLIRSPSCQHAERSQPKRLPRCIARLAFRGDDEVVPRQDEANGGVTLAIRHARVLRPLTLVQTVERRQVTSVNIKTAHSERIGKLRNDIEACFEHHDAEL